MYVLTKLFGYWYWPISCFAIFFIFWWLIQVIGHSKNWNFIYKGIGIVNLSIPTKLKRSPRIQKINPLPEIIVKQVENRTLLKFGKSIKYDNSTMLLGTITYDEKESQFKLKLMMLYSHVLIMFPILFLLYAIFLHEERDETFITTTYLFLTAVSVYVKGKHFIKGMKHLKHVKETFRMFLIHYHE